MSESEYNTEYENDIIKCPYCGDETVDADSWENEDGDEYETQCELCEKYFNVTVIIEHNYSYETETVDQEEEADE